MTTPHVSSPTQDMDGVVAVMSDVDIKNWPVERLNALTKRVASLPESPLFPDQCLINVAKTKHKALLDETMKRATNPLPLSVLWSFLYRAEYLLESEKIEMKTRSVQQQVDVCEMLLQFVPTNEPIMVELAITRSPPEIVALLFKHNAVTEDPQCLIELALEKWLKKKDDTTTQKQMQEMIDVIVTNNPSLVLDQDKLLYSVYKAGPSLLQQLLPYAEKSLPSKLLVRLLVHEHITLFDDIDTRKKYKESLNLLYQSSKDTFLAFKDDQLELFLPKTYDKNQWFWSLHEKERLRYEIEKNLSVQDLEKPKNTHPKKM